MIINQTWYASEFTSGSYEKFDPTAFDSVVGNPVTVTQRGMVFLGWLRSAVVSEDGMSVDMVIEVPDEAIPPAIAHTLN